MSSSLRPTGVYVPLVTPFDERGAVDLEALGRPAEHALDCGARQAVVGVCAEVCARREATLIVGAGTNDTRSTILRHEALAAVAGVAASRPSR